MRNCIIMLSIIAFFVSIERIQAEETNWGVEFSNAIMKRHPGTINDLTGKGWEYSNSIVLYGMQKIYAYTKNPDYVKYIKKYVDLFVDSKGNISFDSSANNMDHLHPGLLCLFLYDQTDQDKYRIAAEKIRQEFDKQPRNTSGGFWHKQKYPNQMWADGIYMAEPFLIEYGNMLDDMDYAIDEASKQVLLLAEHAFDTTNNLLYHGWDETLAASWTDSTGRSPEVWSRGMGWTCMALVDMLDYIPDTNDNYTRFVELINRLAKGIKTYQDETSGLWYQVVDKGNLSSNWIESSGSAMFIYMLKKALDNGYIDTTYNEVIDKGWAGMKNKITLDGYKRPVINDFVRGMGIKNSYSEYVAQSKVSTPTSRYPHGYCAILSLASVMEWPKEKIHKLNIEIEGEGEVVTGESDSLFMQGRYVCLKARTKNGSEFVGWTGDIETIDTIVFIRMDSTLNIKANYKAVSTNINEDVQEELSIFPNPVEKVLYLKGRESFNNMRYTIWAIDGNIVKEGSVIDCCIDVNKLCVGYYLLEINGRKINFVKQ